MNHFKYLINLHSRNKVIHIVGKWIFWAPSIITWIDIGISIGGWVSVTNAEHPLLPTAWSQASLGLLAGIYAYLVGVFVLFWFHRHEYFEEERWSLNGVSISIPLLAIRLAYSLVFTITGNMKFNAIKGNPTAYLIMTMLPEVLIIFVCTYVIFAKISPLQKGVKQPKRAGEENQELYGRI